ncbi:hypothetical protein CGC32_00755 [Helicobacter pylori]|nr:hypothetical protein CGC32_00755 [Helicobacter pylori]
MLSLQTNFEPLKGVWCAFRSQAFFIIKPAFFVIPTIKLSLITSFLKWIDYSDFILKSALALTNPRQ